jgi:hypothetical protein
MVAGKKGKTQKILVELQNRAEREHVDPLAFAWLYSDWMTKKKHSHGWKRLFEEKSSWLIFLNVDELHPPRARTPRFDQLLSKIHLEPG